MNLHIGKVVGGMFITVDRTGKEMFEINMYPVFKDSEDVDRVLMFSMFKKKFRTTDINEIKEIFDTTVNETSGQNIRDLIQVTRIGSKEICVVKDIMSYQVLYNDTLYLTLSDQIEKDHSMCFFATRKAPKYIEVKELRYIPSSTSLLFFLNLVTTIYYIGNNKRRIFI